MIKVELLIDGMSCASCANAITKALKRESGVIDCTVNFATSKAVVEYDPNKITVDRLTSAVGSAGYHAEAVQPFTWEHNDHLAARSNNYLQSFISSAAFTLPLFLQMIAEFLGFPEIVPMWLQMILATIVQFWCGRSFYIGSYHALRAASANMDLLVALGTTAAYLFSLVVFLLDLDESTYFETSAMIITLILMGRWLESRSKKKASESVEKLLKLQPKFSAVEREGKIVEIPTEQIHIDDIFLVRPGENIAVDGIVVEGNSAVNEAALTGESMPVFKEAGSKIFAGTNNFDGSLKARATGVGSHTVFATIIKLVEQAQNSKAPIQRLADKLSAIFVPLVAAISLITFVIWWIAFQEFDKALIHAVSVLVIACPCALGLATPTVILVAAGRAANYGILFKESAALQQAEKIKTLILDKTGTLTKGKPTVVKILPEPPHTEEEILQIAASLEHHSQHPLARAILDEAKKRKIPIEPSQNFLSTPGKGVSAEKRGKRFSLNSINAARSLDVEIDNGKIEGLENQGNTLFVLRNENQLLGFIAAADPLRKNSAEAIKSLHEMGISTLIISGDSEKTTRAIAKQVGIDDYIAGCLPGQKGVEVARLKKTGVIGMVGDGINDAPALALADVSFAIGTGSDVAIEASDITLIRSDLFGVVDAIELSKAAFKKIRQNLFFAFIFNIIAIPLAAIGMLNPIIAAAAMGMSSVLVVSNAILLRDWRPQNTAGRK